jgi:hypothetical protein
LKWLEFIRVQTAEAPRDAAALALLSLAKDIAQTPGLSKADVYAHASVNGDFAISLLWDSDQPQPMGSVIGLNIKDTLKKYGLVDHSVWIEKQAS